MRCYKCDSVLSDTNYCNGCGADVTIYKKIIRLSNTYYNMGLAKAKIRDLSGAADLLRRSVRMDKKNTQARNLLGLVYLEMGEFVEALGQWVISKNIQPEKNLADEYIKSAQSNVSKLEAMNITIKKYNTSLNYALEGNDDLAIIQLKKVLNLNPKFVKAYQLIALLYMKKEEYEKAKRFLNKSLLIDFNNTLSIRYLKEIEDVTLSNQSVKKDKKEDEKKALSGNDVIIPNSTYKDVNYGLMQFLTLVAGIIIGMAMLYFVVIPAKEKDMESEYADKLTNYADKVAGLNLNIDDYENKISELTKERDELKTKVDENTAQPEVIKAYDLLLQASVLYVDNKLPETGAKLLEIGDVTSYSDSFKALYNLLKDKAFTKAFETYYNDAYKAENEKRYDDAITAFKACEVIQPQNAEVLYHIAKCYKAKNNNVLEENSKLYFEKVIQIAPNSEFAGWAKSNLS